MPISEYNQFKIFISENSEISENEIDQLISFCSISKYKKGTYLFSNNNKFEEIYYILEGSVMYSITNIEKVENIFDFRFDNSLVTSYTLQNNYIAKFDVKCVNDCFLISIPIKNIFILSKKHQSFIFFIQKLTSNQLLYLIDYITDLISHTVIERYNNLELRFPDINQNIPQYLIANYLGVSKEHLSRLKKARKFIR
jgi:CRP-like cAMP-binding protein